MKVVTIIGTRPEIIKLSEVIKKLDKYTDHVLVHTGQNYDYELNEVFFKDLDLRKPDYFTESAGDSLAHTIGNILFDVEKILKTEAPDAVVILGDTNSALAGIIAKRMKIPFFHLEAGNRAFDDNVPEEINRRLLDHIADINLVYTANQRLNLIGEGLAKDRLFVMGSPMKEIFNKYRKQISTNDVLERLGLYLPELQSKEPYYLVSVHRDENIEIPTNFYRLVDTINALARQRKVILSTHPRFRKKLEDNSIELHENVMKMKPFGFFDYINLQTNADCVISDSGTISEESSLLGFPAITIRNAIERTEAVDSGSIIVAGIDKETVLDLVDIAQELNHASAIPTDYDIDNCSTRVIKIILGYTGYVRRKVYGTD